MIVWQKVYLIMACLMLIEYSTTILSPEPNIKRKNSFIKLNDQIKFLISFLISISIFILVYSQVKSPINIYSPIGNFLLLFLNFL